MSFTENNIKSKNTSNNISGRSRVRLF